MSYVTPSDVETFVGIAYTDLKVDGRTMTTDEWIAFITSFERPIAKMIHRYCRVPTFDPASSEALVVEYRNGRGANVDDLPYIRGSTGLAFDSDYYDTDITFYLRNLYFTGAITLLGVASTRAALVIEEDTATKTTAPAWTARTARTTGVAGDYEVVTTDELTEIRFHTNIPRRGKNNVKFTYYTGYDPTGPDFEVIKMQVLRCMKNFVMLKKKSQEPLTIRAQGVRDFSTMMDPFDEAHILGDMEKIALEPYRRFPIPGEMFD
jgi:hypothetical protein